LFGIDLDLAVLAAMEADAYVSWGNPHYRFRPWRGTGPADGICPQAAGGPARHAGNGKSTNNEQVTVFQKGILPWALQQPMALVVGEYNAA
jgi:hypothetical protein